MEVAEPKSRGFCNPHDRSPLGLPPEGSGSPKDVVAFHRSMSRYRPTPLRHLPSGAAGLAGLPALRDDARLTDLAEQLNLGPKAHVLLINTEGSSKG